MAANAQSDRDIAEMIAQFRTPPGLNWRPLADDIETVLKARPAVLSDDHAGDRAPYWRQRCKE